MPHPEIFDVHQQLQENALTHIKLPRDISSTDIQSGTSSRGTSPLLLRKNSPQSTTNSENELRPETIRVMKTRVISPSSLTKGFLSSLPKVNSNNLKAGFDNVVPKLNLKPTNLVNKLKTGGAAVKSFTRETASRLSVSYNKQDTTDSAFSESVVIEPPVRRERQRTLSRDDSTIDDGSEIVEADTKEEVILDSCGILATNTKQIFESPQYSFDDVETEQLKHVSKSCEELASQSAEETYKRSEKVEMIDSVIADDSKNNKNSSNNADAADAEKENLTTVTPVIKAENLSQEIDDATLQADSEYSGFQCFCSNKESCPHVESDQIDNFEPVWQLRESQTKVTPESSDLNLGQKRVIDNSEADKILEKYSKSKQTLNHPSLRISFSDSAITSNGANRPVDESPKSVLDLELEINSALQMKLPNLLQSSKMSRKSQRIYENLKHHIQVRLGDKECQSTIIFI